MSVLYSNSMIFVIPVYIFNGRKQTLVDRIGILSALRMRGLHDKRHLLAKLRIWGSENWKILVPKQIHVWYFWEKQVSLTECIHMSMGTQNLDLKKMYLRELSGSKFHFVTSSNVILYNDVKNSIFIKSGFVWFWNWARQFCKIDWDVAISGQWQI